MIMIAEIEAGRMITPGADHTGKRIVTVIMTGAMARTGSKVHRAVMNITAEVCAMSVEGKRKDITVAKDAEKTTAISIMGTQLLSPIPGYR
jgi:hypothetical protein